LANCAIARDDAVSAAPPGEAAVTPGSDVQRIRSLRQIGAAIAPPPGELPENVAERRFANAPVIIASEHGGRGWAEFAYLWQASALSYQPLYFEEPNLERYGHSAGCIMQPAVSAAHFLAGVGALPVRLVFARPWNCVYPLGHAHPGSPTAWQRPR
jgi:hypothetical protein